MSTDVTALRAAKRVADAVLYEGYLLYPYRASASKNQVRWQFGVLGPAGAVEQMVGEDPRMFTECLLRATADGARVDVHLRFLQTQWRAPERCVDPAGGRFEPVAELHVGAANWIPWHEAVEREIIVSGLGVDDLRAGRCVDLAVPGASSTEIVLDEDGGIAGRLVRTCYPLVGRMDIAATLQPTTPPLLQVRIGVENLAAVEPAAAESRGAARDLAARQSYVGTHLLLVATDATFVSVVDPPDWAAAAAAGCRNERCWPVLAGVPEGSERESQIMLAAPIILGDFPAIADESPGDLFDAAEIDEILTLRIMTMTDEEKAAARGTDPRAGAIIDRTDQMPHAVFERLHGALRGISPAEPEFPTFASHFDEDGQLDESRSTAPWFNELAEASVSPDTQVVVISGTPVSKNSRVRLRPNRRADAHDMFLAGRTAVVRRVDLDVDGERHVAVLLEDDPAADLHDWHGRYYYFDPDEIEPLTSADAGGSTT